MRNEPGLYPRKIIVDFLVPHTSIVILAFLGVILFFYILYSFFIKKNKQNYLNLSTFLILIAFFIAVPIKNYVMGEDFPRFFDFFVPAFCTYFIMAPIILWIIDKFVIKNQSTNNRKYFIIYFLLLFIFAPALGYFSFFIL